MIPVKLISQDGSEILTDYFPQLPQPGEVINTPKGKVMVDEVPNYYDLICMGSDILKWGVVVQIERSSPETKAKKRPVKG